MIAIFYLALQILKLYSYVVIANVIVSWLVAFNVLNTQNRQQAMLTNQAADNAAAQFNASSINQTNQFVNSLSSTINQQNAARNDAMNQYNVTESNRVAALNQNNALEAERLQNQLNSEIEKKLVEVSYIHHQCLDWLEDLTEQFIV